jgi:hypothetical protein
MSRATVPALIAALILVVLPADALAAKAIRSDETYLQVDCSYLTNDAGSAYVSVFISESGESDAGVAYWATPNDPESDAPTLNGLSSSISLSADGSNLSVTFDVYVPDEPGEEPEPEPEPGEPSPSPVPTPVLSPSPTGEPLPSDEPGGPIEVGQGQLVATLAPAGDPEEYSSRDKWGNQQHAFSAISQALASTGTLSLPNDLSFELEGCAGSRETYSYFATSPSASVTRFSGTWLACSWSSDDEFVGLYVGEFDSGLSADLWIENAEGAIAGTGPAVLTTSRFETDVRLFDLWSDDWETAVGTATGSAGLSRGERINETESSIGVRFQRKGWMLDVDGSMTVTTPAGTRSYPLDGASCAAADLRVTQLPGGIPSPAPIDNDTPEAAAELGVGDTVSISTVGAQPDPEAPCLIEDPDGGTHEAPIGATVWYTFVAPGGSLTVDTAKSDFDTVVGVYAYDEVGLVNVACNDDPPESLEARVTVETVADATYLIQAGGYAGESGTLFVSLTQP